MTTLEERRVFRGHSLTEAQCSFLLSLPADGAWKRTTSTELDSYGKNALRGFGQSGLIEGYYRETMQHRLTKEGQEVAAALRARAQSLGDPHA